MDFPFDSGFALKILRFFLIINLVVLPFLLLLSLDLIWSYLALILFEGFCSLILGGVQIFSSLFSTIEVENHKYVGDGFWKYELKPIAVSDAQQKAMRIKGVTMVIMGLLLMSVPAALMFLPYLLSHIF